MNIEEFEKIMQRDDKEEKEEDLEKIWDDKSEWFFKRTEKKKTTKKNPGPSPGVIDSYLTCFLRSSCAFLFDSACSFCHFSRALL